MHRASLYRPCEGGPAISGRAAGHGGTFGLVRAVAILALAAACQGVQGAHDSRPVQILCRVVQVIDEGASGGRAPLPRHSLGVGRQDEAGPNRRSVPEA